MNPLLQQWDDQRANYAQLRKDYDAKLADWKKNLPPGQDPNKSDPNKPVEPISPLDHQSYPTVIFNGGVAALTSYALRGVLWYQGETNAFRINTPRAPIDKRGWTIYRAALHDPDHRLAASVGPGRYAVLFRATAELRHGLA